MFCYFHFRIEARELQEACQSCLQDFNLCMFYQPPRQETAQGYMEEDVMWPDDKAAYISDELVFKIIAMCEMVCYQLQKQGMLKCWKVTVTSNACEYAVQEILFL